MPTVDYHLKVINRIADNDLKIANLEYGLGRIVIAATGRTADTGALKKISAGLVAQLESAIESADPASDRLVVTAAIANTELKICTQQGPLLAGERNLAVWREARHRLETLDGKLGLLETGSGDDEFTITGENGILKRGNDGFSVLTYQGERFGLNHPQSKVAECLWKANKDGTQIVRNTTLLKAAGMEGGKVPNIFKTGIGKQFYQQLVIPSASGFYRLDI